MMDVPSTQPQHIILAEKMAAEICEKPPELQVDMIGHIVTICRNQMDNRLQEASKLASVLTESLEKLKR